MGLEVQTTINAKIIRIICTGLYLNHILPLNAETFLVLCLLVCLQTNNKPMLNSKHGAEWQNITENKKAVLSQGNHAMQL